MDEAVTTEEYAAMVAAGKARWGQAADVTWFTKLAEHQREQTAATILAALVSRDSANDLRFDPSDQRRVAYAVAMADDLRAELARKP
jgi:hypothetical protein